MGLVSCVDGCQLVALSLHDYQQTMPRADTRPLHSALRFQLVSPRSVFSINGQLPTRTCYNPGLRLSQARAVIDGLPADVVALALPLDVQKICDAGLIRQDWRKNYPLQSVGGCTLQ